MEKVRFDAFCVRLDEVLSSLALDFCKCECCFAGRNLSDLLNELDETFSEMLFRLIDERGLDDVVVYKRALVDRRLFSKIKKDRFYHPKKVTVISFALALELSLDECLDLLGRAGYTLSCSDEFDVVVRFCFEEGIYNIFDVNEFLDHYGLDLIGV